MRIEPHRSPGTPPASGAAGDHRKVGLLAQPVGGFLGCPAVAGDDQAVQIAQPGNQIGVQREGKGVNLGARIDALQKSGPRSIPEFLPEPGEEPVHAGSLAAVQQHQPAKAHGRGHQRAQKGHRTRAGDANRRLGQPFLIPASQRLLAGEAGVHSFPSGACPVR